MNERHVRLEQLDSWLKDEQLDDLEIWEVGFREASQKAALPFACPVRQCARKRQCQGPLAKRPDDDLWPKDVAIPFLPECLWRYPGEKCRNLRDGLERCAQMRKEGRQGRLPGREMMADRIRRERARRRAAAKPRTPSPVADLVARFERELNEAKQRGRAGAN